jgi:hypothetical protein
MRKGVKKYTVMCNCIFFAGRFTLILLLFFMFYVLCLVAMTYLSLCTRDKYVSNNHDAWLFGGGVASTGAGPGTGTGTGTGAGTGSGAGTGAGVLVMWFVGPNRTGVVACCSTMLR